MSDDIYIESVTDLLTIEVQQHWYAGHGHVEDTARWSVFYEGNKDARPRIAHGIYHSSKGLDTAFLMALQQARTAADIWLRDAAFKR